MYLGDSASSTGGAWNDSGYRREHRQLNHRAAAEVRPVPVSPALMRLLRKHIAEHGVSSDGRLFQRKAAACFPTPSTVAPGRRPGKRRSRQLKRPRRWLNDVMTLPHARLSTWLNAGVAPAQVAEGPATAWPSFSASTPSASTKLRPDRTPTHRRSGAAIRP